MLSPPMNLERRKDLQALIFLQAGRWNFYVMVSSWKSIAVGFLKTGSYGTTLPLSEYIIVDCRTAHPKENIMEVSLTRKMLNDEAEMSTLRRSNSHP